MRYNPTNMSYVSAALTTALKSLEWTQTELSNRAKVDRGMLNRYVRGIKPLGEENLPSLLKTLPKPHNDHLLAAYLRDLIPAGTEATVTILTDAIAAETPPSLPSDLDPKVRKAIDFLARKAIVHTEIKDMLVHFAKVLGFKPS